MIGGQMEAIRSLYMRTLPLSIRPYPGLVFRQFGDGLPRANISCPYVYQNHSPNQDTYHTHFYPSRVNSFSGNPLSLYEESSIMVIYQILRTYVVGSRNNLSIPYVRGNTTLSSAGQLYINYMIIDPDFASFTRWLVVAPLLPATVLSDLLFSRKVLGLNVLKGLLPHQLMYNGICPKIDFSALDQFMALFRQAVMAKPLLVKGTLRFNSISGTWRFHKLRVGFRH